MIYLAQCFTELLLDFVSLLDDDGREIRLVVESSRMSGVPVSLQPVTCSLHPVVVGT